MAAEGLLNIDKPQGITSHDVVSRIRRVGGLRRVGHAGTLDPLATGVLLVCAGRTTRLVEYLVGQPKTYEARIRLGQTTDTYDADGVVLAERPLTATLADIDAALDAFRGPIQQRPPMYSAIKKDGQPLYKLARKGVEVERPLRPVTIYQLDLLFYDPPWLEIRVLCSSGTYIRSLADDLGAKLGCGGHLAALRRTAVGSFTAAESLPLARLTTENFQSSLLPGNWAIAHLPRLALPPEQVSQLKNGLPIPRHPQQPAVPEACVYDEQGEFCGIVQAQAALWQPHKIFYSTR